MLNPNDYIYAQNQDSGSARLLKERIELFSSYIDVQGTIIKDILNIATCNTYGLDCWGALLNESRIYHVPYNKQKVTEAFGFGADRDNFTSNFNNAGDTVTFELSDNLYRMRLVMVAYLSCRGCSLYELNRALWLVFGNYSYVRDCTSEITDPPNLMALAYYLEQYKIPIIEYLAGYGYFMPRPACVGPVRIFWSNQIYDGRYQHNGGIQYNGGGAI